jgi:Undecaprenyl-phosphate glucose phosphotransferase
MSGEQLFEPLASAPGEHAFVRGPAHPPETLLPRARRSMAWRIRLVALTLDLILIIGVSSIAYATNADPKALFNPRYVYGSVIVAAVCCLLFYQDHLYDLDCLMDPVRAIKALLIRWTLVFLVTAALIVLAHEQQFYSRLWIAKFYAGGIAGIGLGRWAVKQLIDDWIARGHYTKAVAIVGSNPLADQLISRLRSNAAGIRVIGVFDDRGQERVAATGDRRPRGTIQDLLDYAAVNTVDLVVITIPLTSVERIRAVIQTLNQQPFNVRVLPGAIGLERVSQIRLPRTELPGIQLIAISEQPLSQPALFVKEAFDRILAVAGLLVLAPVLLACAAGIAFNSPGPILFRQTRIGFKGREFTIVKFRTMHVDSQTAPLPTRRGDPRIFKFGKFLRSFSLDELPQLYNVLKGDMSLVGPRPHMTSQRVNGQSLFEAVNEYAGRHRVKPGMTGWAQVNGWRGPAETIEQIERRVEHDIFYIDNWSLMLDLVILIKTLFVGLSGKNTF